MAITLGAHGAAGSSDGNTASVTLTTQPNTTLLVGVLCGGGSGSGPTVSDNNGNTANFQQVGPELVNGGSGPGGYTERTRVYKLEGGAGGASHMIVATRNGEYPSIFVQEFKGTGVTVEAFTQREDTTTPYTSGTVTPAANGAGLWAFTGINRNTGAGSYTPAAPFVLQDEVNNLSLYYLGAHFVAIQATAAAVELSYAIGGGATAYSGLCHIVALHESGGSSVTGTLGTTLTAATVTAAATAPISGAVNATLAECTLSAVAASTVKGTVGATLAPAALSASAAVSATDTGTLNATLAPATVSATGVAPVSASTTVTLEDASLSASNSNSVVPTLGAHTVKAYATGSGTDPLVTDPITTQPGSTLLVGTLNHVYDADKPPTDIYGNTFELATPRVNYTLWPNSGLGVWKASNIVGGAGHTVNVQTDTTPTDEITVFVIEVRDSVAPHGNIIEVLEPNDLVSGSVNTSAPALLLAFWGGDDGSTSTQQIAVPRDGYTVLHEQQGPGSIIQGAMAYKIEPAAGSYSVGWDESPQQGALLGLFAFEGASGAAATGVVAATLEASTCAASASAPITASAGSTLASVTLASAASSLVVGTLSATLADAAITAAGITSDANTGAVGAVLADATVSAAAVASVAAGLALTLGDATASATGASTVQGSTTVTLADAGMAAEGTTQEVTTGTTTAQLDDAAVAAAGAALIQAVLARALDPATLDASAESSAESTVEGATEATLAPVTLQATATAPIEAVVAALLADAVLAATAGRLAVGVVDATLDAALCVATGGAVDVPDPPPLVPLIASRPDSFADGPAYRPESPTLIAERPS